MYAASVVLYILCYGVFAFACLRPSRFRLNTVFGFCLFMSIQYGPHTAAFTSMYKLSEGVTSKDVPLNYNLIMSFVFAAMGAYFLLRYRTQAALCERLSPPATVIKSSATLSDYRSIFFGLAVALGTLGVILQGGIEYTVAHLQFFLGSSAFSYTEIRRELFSDTSWFRFGQVVRFSVLPVVFAYMVAYGLRSTLRWLYILLATILITVVAIQLNKFFYVYYLALGVLVYLIGRDRTLLVIDRRAIGRRVLFFTGVGIGFLILVDRLYQIQYGDALSRGILDIDKIRETLLFRVFFASSDSLRLWIDYFLYRDDPKWLGVIGRLCSAGLSDCFDPNTFIPYYYHGRELTSMQAGFVGTALGIGGPLFVPFAVGLLLVVISINMKALRLSLENGLYPVFGPVAFLNAFFLTTRELHTAAVSGGALVNALFVFVLVSFFKPKSETHVGFR